MWSRKVCIFELLYWNAISDPTTDQKSSYHTYAYAARCIRIKEVMDVIWNALVTFCVQNYAYLWIQIAAFEVDTRVCVGCMESSVEGFSTMTYSTCVHIRIVNQNYYSNSLHTGVQYFEYSCHCDKKNIHNASRSKLFSRIFGVWNGTCLGLLIYNCMAVDL